MDDTIRRPAGRLPGWLLEIGLLAGLYLAYSLGRLLGDADRATAVGNAEALLGWERALGLDVEAWANGVLRPTQGLPWLAVGMSYWYAALHYVVTPAVLVWAYRVDRRGYPVVRNALVVASVIGLAGFALVPMAPPRMLPGFTDTLAATSAYGWWGEQASAPRGLGELTNQLAAMPSLHVGWAVWCAWVAWRLTSRRWARALAVAYPALTTVVVVVTANHYVLDAVAGALVVVAGVAVAGRLAGSGAPSQQGVIHRQRSHWACEVTQTCVPPQRGHGSSPVPQLASSTRRS